MRIKHYIFFNYGTACSGCGKTQGLFDISKAGKVVHGFYSRYFKGRYQVRLITYNGQLKDIYLVASEYLFLNLV